MTSPHDSDESNKNKWENIIPTEEEEQQDAKASFPMEEESEASDRPDYDELLMLYEESKAKADEHWDQFVRSEAEFKNFQRRVEKRIADTHKFAIDKVLQDLLPIIDGLEQGLEKAPENITESIASMREGIELTLKMFMDTLTRYGVEQVNPLNEVYDPHQHEALTMAEAADAKSGTVITVVQKGYILHGRVVRPARVIVAK